VSKLRENDLLLVRLSKFIPPDGWIAWWFLPSEARVYYAQRVIITEEDIERERKAAS